MKEKCEQCGQLQEDLTEAPTVDGDKKRLCFGCLLDNSEEMKNYVLYVKNAPEKREEYVVEKQLGLPYPGKKRR